MDWGKMILLIQKNEWDSIIMLKLESFENFKEEEQKQKNWSSREPTWECREHCQPLVLPVSRLTHKEKCHYEKRLKPVVFSPFSTDFYTAIGFEPLSHQFVLIIQSHFHLKRHSLFWFLVVKWLVYWRTMKYI